MSRGYLAAISEAARAFYGDLRAAFNLAINFEWETTEPIPVRTREMTAEEIKELEQARARRSLRRPAVNVHG